MNNEVLVTDKCKVVNRDLPSSFAPMIVRYRILKPSNRFRTFEVVLPLDSCSRNYINCAIVQRSIRIISSTGKEKSSTASQLPLNKAAASV